MPNCEILLQHQPNTATSTANHPPCQSRPQQQQTVGGYKEVVVIGNGPSGICLSYFLSGHWPHWNKNPVSDEYLQMRLEYSDDGKSLVEQDLEYLSDGLQGRSSNPVALLYDRLKHPDADLGIDKPSCLSWNYDPLKEIDHVVIGKSSGPGGAWNDLDGSQLTISPSKWMELPELTFSDWIRQERQSANSLNAGLVFSAKSDNFSEDNSLLNGHSTKPAGSDRFDLENYIKKQNLDSSNDELSQSRVSMHDVRNYYRDYVKQKNLDKYLLNNATVTGVRRICCNKFMPSNGVSTCSTTVLNDAAASQNCFLWEVTGLIDKRDRRKASSLTHKGDLKEFRYYCKHLVLANGATDLHNELKVKGETSRFILRSLRELEEKIRDDLPRLQKDPLLIVGSGLSAADAILLAQKYGIRVVHAIRRSVHDTNLIFTKLPKKIYPEYQKVYELMLSHRYNSFPSQLSSTSTTSLNSMFGASININASNSNLNQQNNNENDAENTLLSPAKLRRPLSQNDLNTVATTTTPTTIASATPSSSSHSLSAQKNNHQSNSFLNNLNRNYVLYDEHQIKAFTSKRTCILKRLSSAENREPPHKQASLNETAKLLNNLNFAAATAKNNQALAEQQSNGTSPVSNSHMCRHLHMQKQYHQHHQRQLNEFDEECDEQNGGQLQPNGQLEQENQMAASEDADDCGEPMCKKSANEQTRKKPTDETEMKISYACVLIGFSADLDFLPPYIVNEMARNPNKHLNTKDNPIDVEANTNESRKFKRLYAMGPLIGDNFVRFGTGGALAITSAIVNYKKLEQQCSLNAAANS